MKTIMGILTALAALIPATGSIFGAEQTGQALKFENGPGWIWQIKPNAGGADWTVANIAGLAMRLDELKDEKLLLVLAHTVESTRDIVRFRPVVFNAAGRRFEFSDDSGGSTEGVALQGFTLVDAK